MTYIFKGRLCGYICEDCSEPLSRVKVRLYRTRSEQNVTALAVASPKDTFAVLADKDAAEKKRSLLGEFETNDAGEFVAELGEKQKYNGEAFEVDVYCETVPGRKATEEPPKPLQFSVTVVQPEWRRRDNALVAAWDYCISARYWCFIRAKFDAWVICGRVVVCDTKAPVPQVKVSALDRDWLQDDPLGTAVTDASGKFRIDYHAGDFKKDIFGFNIELFGGPDIYFKVESLSGSTLLAEPPSTGRNAGRENRGPCFCVELCLKEAPVVTHAWFTRVGDFAIYSDIDYLGSGLTQHAAPFGFPGAHGGPGYGFFGAMKLVGDCPVTYPGGGGAMRYRFLYDDGTGPTPIRTANIVAVVVGDRPIMWDITGSGPVLTSQPIYVAPSGATPPGPTPPPSPLPPAGTPWGPIPPVVLVPDADGWVTIDPAATNGGFSGPLLRFNSATVVAGGTAPGNDRADAGNAVASPKNGTTLAIIFQAEPVGGSTPSAPTLTNQLDKIYINNWSDVNAINLAQFTGAGNTPCTGLTTAIDVLYTADHELLAEYGIGISTAATIPPPLPAWPSGTGPRGAHGSFHVDIHLWPACSYLLALNTRRMLTDGEIDDSGHDTWLTFCKD